MWSKARRRRPVAVIGEKDTGSGEKNCPGDGSHWPGFPSAVGVGPWILPALAPVASAAAVPSVTAAPARPAGEPPLAVEALGLALGRSRPVEVAELSPGAAGDALDAVLAPLAADPGVPPVARGWAPPTPAVGALRHPAACVPLVALARRVASGVARAAVPALVPTADVRAVAPGPTVAAVGLSLAVPSLVSVSAHGATGRT